MEEILCTIIIDNPKRCIIFEILNNSRNIADIPLKRESALTIFLDSGLIRDKIISLVFSTQRSK